MPILGTQTRLALATGMAGGLIYLAAGCHQKTQAPFILPIDATTIQSRNFVEAIQAEGTLANPGYIRVTPQTSGLITQVLVKEGDLVKAGDVLIVLDDREERANLQTAQAELNEALIKAKRYIYLEKVGAADKEKAEEMQINAIRAKSKAVSKQEALDKRSMRSPIDGVVGDLSGINPGQYAEVGKTQFVVVNNENLSIDLSIPALLARQVKINQDVKMFDETKKNPIGTGKIAFIPPYFDLDSETNQASNTIRVRAVFVNKSAGLRPNQLIRSQIIIGNNQYPGLPAEAALFKAQQPYTYKLVPVKTFLENIDINPQKKQTMNSLPSGTLIALETPLKLGDIQDNYFPVQAGLKAGDLIPLSGSLMLTNGTPVSIKPGN
ncbi:hypothetical protein KR52_04770 [Synechococcus sp. KORDI-52]|uniref:efflux RND transporter periplasmic adaptor subunit n=1 Tax=Synechococcus sp. KORDI-52 TaxID=585425 RepID=UPI0004E050B7|nr:efflux RND transporter periplasmic adaptor subunit [Synechococcus sp. KORDI-52]AII48460.1 hypothetical protein KR52_04770 [Synechococcus sp. KORDI-52]